MTPTLIAPRGPGGSLLFQTLSILMNGIADGSYQVPVRATVFTGGLDRLLVVIDQGGLNEVRLREVTTMLFPLDLEIQHAGGTARITIALPEGAA